MLPRRKMDSLLSCVFLNQELWWFKMTWFIYIFKTLVISIKMASIRSSKQPVGEDCQRATGVILMCWRWHKKGPVLHFSVWAWKLIRNTTAVCYNVSSTTPPPPVCLWPLENGYSLKWNSGTITFLCLPSKLPQNTIWDLWQPGFFTLR